MLIQAQAEIQTAAKVPTFRSTFYTGGALNISGYDRPVVIDLAGLENGNVLVANLDHDPSKRVGNFTVVNDGTKLVANGTASAATPWRDEVIASAKAGYVWQASLEVQPHKVENLDRGKSVNVNGRTIVGPAYITRKGTLKGFAFVSHGADDNTTVAIAATRKRGTSMKELPFEQFMAQFPVDVAMMTHQELASWHATYCGREGHAEKLLQADYDSTLPMIYAGTDPIENEKRRMRQINAACQSTEWESFEDEVHELQAQAIAGDITVDELIEKTRRIAAEIHRSKIGVGTIGRTGRRNNPAEVIEAAFAIAGGLSEVEKHYPERVLDHASRIQRDCGLQSLLMQAACANGYQAHAAEGITQGNLRRVMEAAFPAMHAQGFSTLSLPGILSNISNKFLLDGWVETAGDEWKKISDIKPVKNFKSNTFYRLLESAEYEQVGPAGEIKHGTLGEQSMTVQASTYGKMYAITRQDIVNDDLGSLTDIPRRLGRAAGMKFRRVFWQAFLAADGFFHSNNGNVVTGSGTALTTSGTALQTAVGVFRAMRTSAADGEKLIGGKPAIIMVPPALEIVARQLLNSNGIIATGDTDTTMMNGNPYQGFAELVVADWLSDTDLTGYSAAKWYLLRSPNLAPAMLVAFLNGQESPTVETADADFNTLGIQMRGYHDFGVGRGEPLCGVQVAGTA
jgi:hypothetical protein